MMHRSTLDRPCVDGCRARRRGFTLMELLIVVGVIVILIGIAFTIGVKVTGSGKKSATEGVLKAVDIVFSEYAHTQEKNPKGFYWDQANNKLLPAVDGRYDGRVSTPQDQFDLVRDPAQPSLGPVLLEIGGSAGAAGEMLKGVDPKYIVRRTSTVYAWNTDAQGRASGTLQPVALEMVEVLDGWGNPIRCVLPGAFGGGYGDYYPPNSGLVTRPKLTIKTPPKFSVNPNQPLTADFTRSFRPYDPAAVQAKRPVGDADEGTPLTTRPYAYSAGADGNPGGRADNVYLARPKFPRDTQGMDE